MYTCYVFFIFAVNIEDAMLLPLTAFMVLYWILFLLLFAFWQNLYVAICFLQVTISPEVASRTVNRAIIAELVRLYKESDLGMRLPAYDGRKSLYTAGELPFAWKEFVVKLVDEEDGINGPKWVISYINSILDIHYFLLNWSRKTYIYDFTEEKENIKW